MKKKPPSTINHQPSTILGIGTDIVEISRIEKLMKKLGAEKFAEKILSAEELKNTSPKLLASPTHLAKRFAGKEAIAKALGTGIGKHLAFKDITITNDKNGAPIAKVKNQKSKIHLSLADEKSHALAFAVVES